MGTVFMFLTVMVMALSVPSSMSPHTVPISMKKPMTWSPAVSAFRASSDSQSSIR